MLPARIALPAELLMLVAAVASPWLADVLSFPKVGAVVTSTTGASCGKGRLASPMPRPPGLRALL